MLLFHATDLAAARRIDQSGRFRPGSHGFAGGAIYFSSTAKNACRKHRNGRGNPDIVIQCEVDLGWCLDGAERRTVDCQRCYGLGYDTVKIAKVDVYAVYDPTRIRILKFRQVGSSRWFDSMQALDGHQGSTELSPQAAQICRQSTRRAIPTRAPETATRGPQPAAHTIPATRSLAQASTCRHPCELFVQVAQVDTSFAKLVACTAESSVMPGDSERGFLPRCFLSFLSCIRM